MTLYSSDELTVFCVCVGDKYPAGYVYALRDMVKQHLTIPHVFKCITPYKLPGILTRNPPVPYQSWWSKIGLFYPEVATGPSLFFDLDVSIVGNIDYLANYTNQFSAVQNWPQSGHGGLQSSVMAWPGNWTYPFDYIKSRDLWPSISKKFHGDQEYIYYLLSTVNEDYQRIPGVCSYKYHCLPQQKIPATARIVVFHGEPKPDKIEDQWLLPYTQILRSHIKKNTRDISIKGLSATG